MFGSVLDSERAFGHHRTMARTRVRRRRLILALSATALAGAWAGPVAGALGGPEAVPVARTTYVVRSGDTLWSIAETASPGEDPRPLVDAIVAANGIDPGALVPGQTLVVPLGA